VAEHESRVRVRYAETDQMGVVYHANYLIWMEVARVDFCTAIGLRYRDLEREEGIYMVVVEANCRYLRPARFDDEVRVRVFLEATNGKMIRFGYEMHNAETSELLATGFTKHLCVGRDMKTVRLPERYLQAFS
jgi:acyl-CoA thioester hydrolase